VASCADRYLEGAGLKAKAPHSGKSLIVRRLWLNLVTFGVAFMTIAILWATAPDVGGIMPVASDRIVLVDPGTLDLPRNPDAASRRVSFERQFDWGAVGSRQYHFSLPIDLPRNQGYSVLVPMLGGESSLHINSILSKRSEPNTFTGPGFGVEHLLGRVPASYLKSAFNRVDLVMRSDPTHTGARLIYFGETNQLLRASETLIKWASSVHTTLMIGAMLGLACSLLGLYVVPKSPLYAGGLIIALMVMPLLFPMTQRPFEMILVPVSLAGLALSLSRSTQSRTVMLAAFRGFALVLAVSLTLRGLLAFSSVSFSQPLPVIHIANLGMLPLLGIGLPLLLGSDLRNFRAKVANLRHFASEQAALVMTKDKQLHEEIRSRAVLEERQRFTRDVHDGIGGHMQSLLMRVRMGKIPMAQVESEISKGIADLRLVVDSLDHVGNDLGAAMATFQTRARHQLDAANIEFAWHQSADFDQIKLTPQAILGVYRIMQEALTNCVRHSGACRFSIELANDTGAGQISIAIEDNGAGIPEEVPMAGRGMRSMRERAALLGGTLAIAHPAVGSGTRITLIIPAGLSLPL
jgi:signal transduction histidine kinase